MGQLNADDRWAIAEIVSLHGHLFDEGRLDRLADIFVPEVVYDMSDLGMGTFEGIETIRRAALQLGERNPLAHLVTNVVIVDDAPDAATVKSKGLVIRADGTFGNVSHLDTLVRRDGQWRISRRVITALRAPWKAAPAAVADDR